MTKYFKDRFAVYGDAVEIPNSIQSNGSVSYQQGFTVDYQRRLGSDPLAKPFPRQGFNGLISDITGAIQQYQQQGFYDFITPEMNEGNPFGYSMGATVRYDMSDDQDGSNVHNFTSLINDNKTNPKDNPENWQDIGKTDIEFATNEEILLGTEPAKAISPLGLASLKASTNNRGIVQLATSAEFWGGTNDTKATSPFSIVSAFKQYASFGISGYQTLPGGLIIQWVRLEKKIGSYAGTYNFPLTFPNACFGLNIGNSYWDGPNGWQTRAAPINNSSYKVREDVYINNGVGNDSQAFMIAIGY